MGSCEGVGDWSEGVGSCCEGVGDWSESVGDFYSSKVLIQVLDVPPKMLLFGLLWEYIMLLSSCILPLHYS